MSYVVYTDNFYTSPQLCKDLLTKGFYSTGTIRTNRKNFPVMLTQKRRKCERGDCTFSYHDHITAVKWHDNRDVFAMSTFVSDKMTTVKRQKDSGPRVDISCPEMISDYVGMSKPKKYVNKVGMGNSRNKIKQTNSI